MRKVGIANLPLHPGKCPKWLFERMVRLGGAITKAVIIEHGEDGFLKRVSDPFFFQSLGCVLGFDFHSSGLTTTVCGALKEAIKHENLGLAVAGGKGKASRKTPLEIAKMSDVFSLSTKKIDKLKYSSRMSAKVDNSVVQDGFNLYHHVFIFTERGKWSVIQQGLNENMQYARRYHWLSDDVKSFVEEPHTAICSDIKQKNVLNMVANESKETRKVSVDIVKENPKKLRNTVYSVSRHENQSTLERWFGKEKPIILSMPKRINWRAVDNAYNVQPKN